MGHFFELGAVLASESEVRQVLKKLLPNPILLNNVGILETEENKTLLFFDEDDDFGAEDDVKDISKELQTSAFYFHVHDGDLWMYHFYKNGEQLDQFNTQPDYWNEISDEEMKKWKGTASTIVDNWPGVYVKEIENYLVHLGSEDDSSEKAYDDDEFEYWDIWQLTDFMKKLGVPYPSDDCVEEEEYKEGFELDSDSYIFLGLGLYGLYMSGQLQSHLILLGYIFATFLLVAAVLNSFRKTVGNLCGIVVSLCLICFGFYQIFNDYSVLSAMVSILCGVVGGRQYYKSYKELRE